MEHRWHPRRPVRVDVTLYHRDRPVAVCRSRDVSRDGIFFEVDSRVPGLDAGTFVTADLRWRDAHGTRRTRVGGLVVHRARDGLGVLLVHREASAAAAVAALARDGLAPPLAPVPELAERGRHARL